MRYWFDETKEQAFALDVEPPDGEGIYEIDEATYKEIVASQPAPAPVQPEPDPMREYVENDFKVMAEQASEIPRGAMVNMETLARVWRKMQDRRDNLKHEYEAQDKQIEAQQKQVGAALLDAMNKMGGTKLLTAAGQIEKKTVTHVNGKDWGAFYRFIKDNDAWPMLHKRITTAEVEKWAKSHDGALPPGVDVYTEFKVSVKKPGTRDVPASED